MKFLRTGLAVTAFTAAAAMSGCGGATPTVLCETADDGQVTVQNVGRKYSRIVITNADDVILHENTVMHGEATVKAVKQAEEYCRTNQLPAPRT